MITNHKYYLSLAFNKAEINLGRTKLNPSVGTIIVKNNTVLSSGTTSINGRPHAESNDQERKRAGLLPPGAADRRLLRRVEAAHRVRERLGRPPHNQLADRAIGHRGQPSATIAGGDW